MRPQQVDVLERETVYQGYFRINRFQLRHEQYAGGMGQPLMRELFERGHAAAVLPIDPVNNKIILIEQFRLGAYAAGMQPWLLECVAGMIETGETPEEVCIRETEEEAGCTITDLIPMAPAFLTSAGGSSETLCLYAGRVDASNAGGLHGLAQEGEDIRVTTWSIDDALQLLADGKIMNAKTIIALQWLALNSESVTGAWPQPQS